MSILSKKGTSTLKFLFTRELVFCYPDLSFPDLQSAIYRELVQDGYDFIWFYHPIHGAFISQSMLSTYNQIHDTNYKQVTQRNVVAVSNKRRNRAERRKNALSTAPLNYDDVDTNDVYLNGSTLSPDNFLHEVDTLLRFDREINVNSRERRIPKIAIVILDVTSWIENPAKYDRLMERLQDYRESVGMNQLIMCFENLSFEDFRSRFGTHAHYQASIVRYFPELFNDDVNLINTPVVKILTPTIAEIRDYLNRLKFLGEWDISADEIGKIAILLSEVAFEGLGEYRPERGEKPAPRTLADIHSMLNNERLKLVTTLATTPKLTTQIVRKIFLKREHALGLARLEGMVGMQQIKNWITFLGKKYAGRNPNVRKNISRFSEPFISGDGVGHSLKLHCTLAGNPGTGKTTIARIIGECLYEVGALPTNKFIQCTAKDLMGDSYTSAAMATNSLIERAIGGVLFIDEISGLLGQEDPIDPDKSDINNDARLVISSLLSAMTTYPELSIIVGGYQEDIRKFVNLDNGLSRRFANPFVLKDYNCDELAAIFRKKCSERNYAIEAELDVILPQIMQNWLYDDARPGTGWGNAGEVENLVNRIIPEESSKGQVCSSDLMVTLPAKNGEVYDFQKYIANAKNQPDPFEELNSLVGLERVKRKIRLLEAQIHERIKEGHGTEVTKLKLPLNYLFLGNPGTGKTTVAKMFGKILTKIGALQSARVVELSPGDISSSFLGGSTQLLKKRFQEAMGAVLFIDEAYALTPGASMGNSHAEDMRAVAELVKLVDEYKGQICVILAGYTKEMQEFLRTNSGLQRRFSEVLEFDNYTESELLEIFHRKISAEEWDCSLIEHDLMAEIHRLSLRSTRKDFGNAGEIDNLINRLKSKYSSRYMRQLGSDSFVKKQFVPSDFLEGECAEEISEIAELNSLPGLKIAKSKIIAIQNRVRMNIAEGKTTTTNLNFLFTGNPGTGKTKVANLMGGILKKLGVLSSDKIHLIKKTTLLGRFRGHTELNAKEEFESAIGEVLFIDEAYQFAYEPGTGIVDELLTFAEEQKGRLCIILAGYENEMDRLFSLNPGLRQRFPESNHVRFEDYNDEELCEIFKIQVQKNGYEMNESAMEALKSITHAIKTLPENKARKDLQNARGMISLFAAVDEAYNARKVEELNEKYGVAWIADEIDKSDLLHVFTETDLYNAATALDICLNATSPIVVETANAEQGLKELLEEIPTLRNRLKKKHNEIELRKHIEKALLRIETDSGYGSAFIISPKGYAFTATHVIEGATYIKARASYINPMTGKPDYVFFGATVVRQDSASDLTILKLDTNSDRLPYVSICGEAEALPDIPAKVLLAGYPFAKQMNNPNFASDIVTSYQENEAGNPQGKIMLQTGSKHGHSGGMCVDIATGKVIGIFHGAIRQADGQMTEEFNYALDIRDFYKLMSKEDIK